MRSHEVWSGTDRHYAGRIDSLMTFVIVALDMLHVHSLGNTGKLEDFAREAPEIGIVDDPMPVAFEVAVIDFIEAHERREQPDISFGQ